jgi:hypothetical protein
MDNVQKRNICIILLIFVFLIIEKSGSSMSIGKASVLISLFLASVAGGISQDLHV